MKNLNDVSPAAVTGVLWHAQSVSGNFASPLMRNRGYDALRFDAVRNARISTPALVATKATAKQAPQSRGSSAHT